MDTPPPGSARPAGSPLLLVIAWLVVVAPAVWGVSQTVQKSLALFRSGTATTTAPATATRP